MGCRKLWTLIKGLPPESNLCRKHRPDLVELFDQWMRAIVELWTSKPGVQVEMPSPPQRLWPEDEGQNQPMPEPEPTRIDTNDPSQIDKLWRQLA